MEALAVAQAETMTFLAVFAAFAAFAAAGVTLLPRRINSCILIILSVGWSSQPVRRVGNAGLPARRFPVEALKPEPIDTHSSAPTLSCFTSSQS